MKQPEIETWVLGNQLTRSLNCTHTRSLGPHCSPLSRAPIHSFIHLLTHSLAPELDEKVLFQMTHIQADSNHSEGKEEKEVEEKYGGWKFYLNLRSWKWFMRSEPNALKADNDIMTCVIWWRTASRRKDDAIE